MVFSSVIFLQWFLPLFLPLYLLADRRYKNGIILLASIVFYAWGAPKFVFALLGTTFLDFYLVRAMARAQSPHIRKRWLLLSLGLNLGLLAFFKYSNFFIENLNGVLAALGLTPMPWMEVVLPIGISFFVFESMTYVIDVYRRREEPLERFWDYQMYILFFPKLISGPILRYHDMADQIRLRRDDAHLVLTGFYRFVLGLSKKILLADKLGAFSAALFATDPAQLSAWQAWLGIICFMFQIYYDFSGYSDMALGLARMMGFRLPENFNNPFISGSVAEYWRRWHMSLSRWMREYLYEPLGGSEKGKVYRNLLVVFLLSGLWHGAAWHFVLWGGLHGIWVCLERAWLQAWWKRLGRLPAVIVTNIVLFGFLAAFKAPDMAVLGRYTLAMVGAGGGFVFRSHTENWLVFGLALLFAYLPAIGSVQKLQEWVYAERHGIRGHLLLFALSMLLLIFCQSFIVWVPHSPFLYFQF